MLVWIFAWLAACTLTFVLYINMQCVIPENIHAPPMEGHWKFLGGGGVLKAKLLEEKYEAKLEFPGGEEVQNKKPSIRGTWIFSGTTQWFLLA